MQRLEIRKGLVVEEDLALDDAPSTQVRAGKDMDVTPLKLFKIVKSIEELKQINVEKFHQSVIFGAPDDAPYNNIFFQWYPDSNLPEDLPHVVSSDNSPTGRWIEQVFVTTATFARNFVTIDTPQIVGREADKQWLGNQLFLGDSSFGQITLGADEESASLKMSFVDTRGRLFKQEAFIGFDSLGDDDFVVVNKKDNGKIAFGNELTFLGDAKNINNVALAALPHQAVPKAQLDSAKAALEQAIAEAEQRLEEQIDDLATEVRDVANELEQTNNQVSQNTQNIASNASDIVENTTRIDELEDKISRITQTGVIIGQIAKTKDQVEVDRETILDAFVQERKGREPLEGDSIYTTDSYGYYRHSNAWSDPYTVSIGIATTTTAGLVKSVDNVDGNRGKIKVESSSGEMSIVKGEQLPYKDQANTFEEDNVFNKNLRILRDLDVVGVGYAAAINAGRRAPGDPLAQPEDSLFMVYSYDMNGAPSRLKGLATYNKRVDVSGATPCEIVNVEALLRYVGSRVPSDIARTSEPNTFNQLNKFAGGLSVTGGNFSVNGNTVVGGSSTLGNGADDEVNIPGVLNVEGTALYNKDIVTPDDYELVNHKWMRAYVGSHGGGGGSGASGKTVATIRTIPYQGLYNGAMVYQEVDVDGAGEIVKYRDFYVRGFISSAMFNMADGSDALKQRVPLPNDVEFERLYVGKHHMYAIPKAGEGKDNYMYSVGWNAYGQLGDGTTTNRFTAVEKVFASRVKKVLPTQNGGSYCLTYVLLENGDLYVSGWDNDGYSGLGRKGSTTSWTRTRSGVLDVWSSSISVFILSTDGYMYACGRGQEGQLGIGESAAKVSWTKTTLSSSQLAGFKKFDTSFETQGDAHWCTSLALTSTGLYGCGRSIHGELGKLDTSVQNSFLAFPLSSFAIDIANVTDVASTPLLTILLHEIGGNTEVWTGGYGTYGHGDGTSSAKQNLTRVLLLEGTGWQILTNQKASIYSDKIDCIFIVNKSKEEIWAWGANGIGELGIGINGNTPKATKVPLPAKSSFQFEVETIYDPQTNVCSLAVIIDGTFFACGNGTTRRVWNSTPILTPIN